MGLGKADVSLTQCTSERRPKMALGATSLVDYGHIFSHSLIFHAQTTACGKLPELELGHQVYYKKKILSTRIK